MIGHTHHTAIKQHSSTIAEFDIHRKPKIRKSVFLHGQEISYFSAAVSGSISYCLMFLGVIGTHTGTKIIATTPKSDEKNATILWKNGMLEVRVKKVLKKKA